MSLKPRILFVFDHKYPEIWADGLWAALNILEEDFEITRLNLAHPKDFVLTRDDFILGWGAFGSKVDKWVKGMPNTKALCIAGNAIGPYGADAYDVLFYETKWYRQYIKFHKHIVHAFGINTDIFCPVDIPIPVIWDYIGVGSFSSWKRWEKMSVKKGNKLVIGEYQIENEQESNDIVRSLLKDHVMVSNMVNPFELANYYHWSRTLYMPSDENGGGERAVLEARSCGLQVEIEDDNQKLKDLLDCPIPDHISYAQSLKKGILEVL